MYSLLTSEQIDKLENKLRELIAKYGQVNHRTRAQFICDWLDFLKKEGINDNRYIDYILKRMGK